MLFAFSLLSVVALFFEVNYIFGLFLVFVQGVRGICVVCVVIVIHEWYELIYFK